MKIRAYNQKTDEKYVLGTFLHSIRFNGLAVQVMSKAAKTIFMSRAAKDFRRILEVADTLIAEESVEGMEMPVAWVCMSIHKNHKVLHYCYNDQAFRSLGIISNLFKEFAVTKEEEIDCSYWTYNMRKCLKGYKFYYNPFYKNAIVHDAI